MTTKTITASWKTTAAGILGVVAVAAPQILAYLDSDPATLPQWGVVVAAILTACGLTAARDHDVSSESAGAQ